MSFSSKLSCRPTLLPLCGVMFVFGATALFLSISIAQAGMVSEGDVPPGLIIRIDGPGQGGGPPDHVVLPDPPGHAIAEGKGKWRWAGTEQRPGRWKVEYLIDGDPDPFLSGTFTITNLTNSADDFTVTATLPVIPMSVQTVMGGSVSLNLIDLTYDSGGPPVVESTTAGAPVYTARVDGVDEATLLDAPQSFVGTEDGTSGFGPADFGVPIPSLVGPSPVTTDMEIEINVRVSAGDLAVVVATFVLEPVPEPSTLALAAFGLLGLVAFRRRR